MKTKTFDDALEAAYYAGFDAGFREEPRAEADFDAWRASWAGLSEPTDEHTGMTEAEAERLLGPILNVTQEGDAPRENLGATLERLNLGNARGRRRSW